MKPFCGNRADWERFDAGFAMLKEQDNEIYALRVELATADKLAEDYAELLKEQEPAAPGILQDLEGIWSTCPRCKSKLWLLFGMTMEINPDHMPKYCPQCGKPIKWEGKTI